MRAKVGLSQTGVGSDCFSVLLSKSTDALWLALPADVRLQLDAAGTMRSVEIAPHITDAAELEPCVRILRFLQTRARTPAALARKRRASLHPALQTLALAKRTMESWFVVAPADSLLWLASSSGAMKPQRRHPARVSAPIKGSRLEKEKAAGILVKSSVPSLAGAGEGEVLLQRAVKLCGSGIAMVNGCLRHTAWLGRWRHGWF